MFKHEKQLFHSVGVEKANPQYAVMLQEQLGGGTIKPQYQKFEVNPNTETQKSAP